MSIVITGSKPNRITARAAKAARMTTPTSPTSCNVTPPSRRGTKSAARMNTSDPAQCDSNSQISRRYVQLTGDSRAGPVKFSTIPATTTAITPDTWNCSAVMKVA